MQQSLFSCFFSASESLYFLGYILKDRPAAKYSDGAYMPCRSYCYISLKFAIIASCMSAIGHWECSGCKSSAILYSMIFFSMHSSVLELQHTCTRILSIV